MIGFFRKIRKKLADDNKPTQYLRYAIGEILLVVIGILIALQINNWNEERLGLIQEKTTLSNLNIEFKENLKNLDSIDKILLHTISATERIFKMFKEEPNQDSRKFDILLHKALASPSWKPSEFVLNDLKNSGGLSKLNNNELKKLLFKWSRFFNELQETMSQIENTNHQLINFVKEYGSLRNLDVEDKVFNYGRSKLQIDNISLLENYKFENYIDDKLYILKEAKTQYADTKELIHELLKATEIE